MRDTLLTELIATRLCHDLTGPIGAINNGAEFMAEEGGDMQGQAAELIASSAQEAVARLMFYRMVYGRIPTIGETGISERLPQIEAFLAGYKIPLHWQLPVDQGGLPHSVFRILCNIILMTACAMLRKGSLHVNTQHSDHAWQIQVHTEGGSTKWEQVQTDAVQGRLPADALDPKTAQLVFTSHLLLELNGTVNVTSTDESLIFTASIPF
jgi:histidine phosphotransferase ChpT